MISMSLKVKLFSAGDNLRNCSLQVTIWVIVLCKLQFEKLLSLSNNLENCYLQVTIWVIVLFKYQSGTNRILFLF